MKEPIRVLVTGAAGQIGYSLVYMIGSGNVFGSDQPIILHLLDIPPVMGVLNGVTMELQDCALPLLHDIIATDKEEIAFANIDAAFLVGAMPRKEGMERSDLLGCNAKIFKSQGAALDKHAKKTVKVLVVGNPANTNALICSKHAPSIPQENFSAMIRLDENRMRGLLSKRLHVTVPDIKNCIVWGNHSTTMFPDVSHGSVTIDGKEKALKEAINDDKWLKEEFVPTIQKRGAQVIAARKLSSAMSAAKAAGDHMRDWWYGTKEGHWVCMSVCSKGEYGVDKGLFFGFPCTVKNGEWKVVEGLTVDDYAKHMIEHTKTELLKERDLALK